MQVLQIDDQTKDIELRYLKEMHGGVYEWEDGQYWQSASEIISCVSPPTLLPGRGIRMKFDLSQLNELTKM